MAANWHENAEIFQSFIAKREKEREEKKERYKRNITCAAEEIVSTERSYNRNIHILGTALKEEGEKTPNVADFFSRGLGHFHQDYRFLKLKNSEKSCSLRV